MAQGLSGGGLPFRGRSYSRPSACPSVQRRSLGELLRDLRTPPLIILPGGRLPRLTTRCWRALIVVLQVIFLLFYLIGIRASFTPHLYQYHDLLYPPMCFGRVMSE